MATNRIPLLLVAAGIQYIGSSTRRQYETLLKIAAVAVPSVRRTVDKNIAGQTVDSTETDDNWFVKVVKDLKKNIDTFLNSATETVSDLVLLVMGALLMAVASIWLVFGFLVELLFGLVAEVMRGNGRVNLLSYLRGVLADFEGVLAQMNKAWNAALDWDLVSAIDNTEHICTVTEPVPPPTPDFAFTTAYSFCAQARPYKEYGVRLDYRLVNGRIEFRDWSESARASSTPPAWRPFASGGGISYHRRRSGHHSPANQLPQFDMMVASNDRVFAKVKGKSDFWFATPAEMFVGTEGAAGLPVPSLYFKLDPTPLDPPEARVQEISKRTGELNDYSREHPQAARLPLLHALVGGGALPAMVVSVKPRTMYRLDTRPPRVGVSINNVLTDSPKGLRTRAASKHKTPATPAKPLGEEQIQSEFAFDLVQGLGVGNYHFYDNWTADHGGEIQFLLMNSAFGLRLSTALYGLFNGPIQDADGACDGTCNFYVLARLKRNNGSHRWGILWCDEQTFFTKRWRLVDPRDNLPDTLDLPDDVNLSVHALVKNDNKKGILNGMIDFDESRFLASDPFEQGWIDERSRLAVARQVLVVNGKRKPRISINLALGGNQDCLYSINFSYGSIDRQWRVRELPGTKQYGGQLPTMLQPEFDFDSLHVREDMTISLRGSRQGPNITGRWVQRYLPCDRRYPVETFSHPWRYLPEASYQRLLRYPMFGILDPHVDGRNQCYEIDILAVDDVPLPPAGADATLTDKLAAMDGLTLADLSDRLYIRARVFKWGAMNNPAAVESWLANQLPQSIRDGDEIGETGDRFFFSWHKTPAPQTEYRLSRTSMYKTQSEFRLLQRGQLGWLLVWKDKRDDDLISLSDLPMEVTLDVVLQGASIRSTAVRGAIDSSLTPFDPQTPPDRDLVSVPGSASPGLVSDLLRPKAPQRVRIRINRHQRIELPPCASRVDFVTDPTGVSNSVLVQIHSPLPPVQFIRNSWKLHLAALPDGATAPKRIGRAAADTGSGLSRLEQGLLIQSGSVVSTPSGGSIWSMAVAMNAEDMDALKKGNQGSMATCVWLEGPTGMMSTPDWIEFVA